MNNTQYVVATWFLMDSYIHSFSRPARWFLETAKFLIFPTQRMSRERTKSKNCPPWRTSPWKSTYTSVLTTVRVILIHILLRALSILICSRWNIVSHPHSYFLARDVDYLETACIWRHVALTWTYICVSPKKRLLSRTCPIAFDSSAICSNHSFRVADK